MKVGIVGSGFVGATAAYAVVMQGIGREIVLVGKNADRAVSEADDIRHAVPFASPLKVLAGDYGDLVGSQVVVLCAGVGQKPDGTRLLLLQRNAEVFSEVVPSVLRYAPDGGSRVFETFPPSLNEQESELLSQHAQIIRQALNGLLN